MDGARSCGPYKATKMWNEMVETFRNGIPLKRHRRHIKVYDHCFTGQEAVNWFQSVLQNCFFLGNSVTREQTIQLLNKFLKAGVFQNINAATPFDVHYQFLKEGDLYHLSDINSTRLPLANKSLNIPPKSRLNQWSVENKDGVPNKGSTTACSQPEMAEHRLDAHHTLTTRSSIKQPTDGNFNHHVSPLSDQHIRSKSDMQFGANYRGGSINQMNKGYGTLQTSVCKDTGHENYTHAGVNHSRQGIPEHHSTQHLSAGENQHTGTSVNCNGGYYISSTEQDKMYPGRIMTNSNLRSEKTSICSPVNSKDNKELGSPRSYVDSCKWPQPPILDSVHTFDMEKRICIEQPHAHSSTTLGNKQFRISPTLPRSQTIQRSSSMIQPKLDLSKPHATTNHDSGKSLHIEKLPRGSADGSGLTKPLHCDISNATVRRNPYLDVHNSAFSTENSIDQCGLDDGKQIHYYPASTSQCKSNQNNVTSSVMQKERDPFSRSGSFGFPRSHSDEPITSTVPGLIQPFEIGEIWKKVILARFQRYTPGLEVPFRLYLHSIPCEWLTANASSEVHLQHDSQFPQSLVAAMDCLVHWPQTVPNEIITAFKEHYFKLKQPLTTFKLYSILSKVFLYVATGNLAMSKEMVLRQSELSSGGPLTMLLPPNSCFETAFTSDSPVTRIVPQRCVDTLHFSRHGQQPKNIPPKRISSAPNLCEPLPDVQAVQKRSSRSRTKRQIIGGRRAMKLANKKASRRVKTGMDEDRMLCHFRNNSGGYVNPALSKSTDDIIDTDDFVETAKIQAQHNFEAEQELDYVAALESLNTLMRCSRRDYPSVAVGGKVIDAESDTDQNGNRSSESSSYYTAVSSSSSGSEASSRRSSVLVDSLENVNTGGMMHMNIGESGEKLMVTIMQLLLLCIPVYNRVQLRYLLHFMNQWNLHHSLCVQTDVVDIFTPTILRSECEANFDAALARSIVYFLMSHHDLVLSVPSDLVAEVQFLVTRQHTNTVSDKSGNMTYCQQVSSRQFEHQRLTGSQLALSELLEQILSDCKMGPKEKRKRLKMFQDAYPHIYRRRFPDSAVQDKDMKKPSRGLLNLGTLSRLKSMRV